VDDRGHFYKPLQRGPRGDRERQFYTTVAALLAAEQDAAAAAAAAEAVQRSQPLSMPRQNGDAAGPAGSGGGAPWHPRRLRQLFPSFRGILKLDTGPVAVAQARLAAPLLPKRRLPSASALLFALPSSWLPSKACAAV
jgi:1D-myo-inositol-tetrakisphosphate 5-kinase/inositol-polyphosphate multikinase